MNFTWSNKLIENDLGMYRCLEDVENKHLIIIIF